MKFKVGDVVICLHNRLDWKYKKGVVLDVSESSPLPYLVEFFESIQEGHEGYLPGKGKKGHCKCFYERDLILYQSILSKFIEEMEKEDNCKKNVKK